MIPAPLAGTAPPCYPAWLLAHFAPIDWRSFGLWLAPILAVVLAIACVLNQLMKKKRLTMALLAPLLAVSFLLPPVLFQASRAWNAELVAIRLVGLGAGTALLSLGLSRARIPGPPIRFAALASLSLGVMLLVALWFNLRDF